MQKKYALIIAINTYADKTIPELDTPRADAEALKKVLIDIYGYPPEDIVELYDSDATRVRILDSLRDFAKKEYGMGDSILIYYGGHGYKDNVLDEGYWVPYDGNKSSNFISVSDVQSRIKATKATHILLISDSCFSGAFTRRDRAFDAGEDKNDDKYLKRVLLDDSRQVITSGGEEPVADSNGAAKCVGHSVFACYLIDALKENSTGYLTADDLISQIDKPVTRNSDQKPEMAPMLDAGDKAGQFVFIRADSVGAGQSGNGCGENAEYDSAKDDCFCITGYQADSSGNGCVLTGGSTVKRKVHNRDISADGGGGTGGGGCGSNANFNSDGECYCRDGYSPSEDGVNCVADNSASGGGKEPSINDFIDNVKNGE